ncbi:MAG: lactonase family protein [Gemmatimonadaceae bacterium]
MTQQHPLSRRDFVSATALGAFGLLNVRRLMPEADTRVLYVGAYTTADRYAGIYTLRFDSMTGALQQMGTLDAGPNPSFLTLHPDGRTLYAVNEAAAAAGSATGAIFSFRIATDSGGLTPLNDQMSEGTAPVYVSTDRKGRMLFVANYASGTVAVLPIDDTGALGVATQVVQHTGKGPVADRQAGPHAHCVVPHPSNRIVLAADLGADSVIVYRLDEAARRLVHVEQADAVMSGTGPRHLVFHPRLPLVFVVGELSSTITALHCNPTTGALTLAQSLSTLPARTAGANAPADVHIAPDGRSLYVSNRGHNSIAVYSVASDKGTLALQQVVPTGGDWPRNFTIDPSGRWLLAANQRSGSVVVFARDAGGRLTPTSQRIDVPGPACLRFQGSSSWT